MAVEYRGLYLKVQQKEVGPHFGFGRKKFVPICSDFPVFFRFAPICIREYLDLFRSASFSSDLFRFVFSTDQNKSGKPLSTILLLLCKSPKKEVGKRSSINPRKMRSAAKGVRSLLIHFFSLLVTCRSLFVTLLSLL